MGRIDQRANRPWGESSMGRIVQRLGETSMGRKVHWAKRPVTVYGDDVDGKTALIGLILATDRRLALSHRSS